jgi:hypothetical protein
MGMENYNKLIDDALNADLDTKDSESLSCEKIKVFGQIQVSKNWIIEIAQVSWNKKEPKYEIRRWKSDGTAGKGVSLNKDQLKELAFILNDMNL